jgi:hypothetical protein
MRSHRVGGSNSIWLPLFNGPRHDRLRRLWQQWAAKPPESRDLRGTP